MAHHSGDAFSGRSDAVRREMEAKGADLLQQVFAQREKLPPEYRTGATGEFPQGKLTPEDEGEIRVGVTVFNGKVVIDFGKPIAWMGMDPQQARAIGQLLIDRAAEIPAAE